MKEWNVIRRSERESKREKRKKENWIKEKEKRKRLEKK
jgi:hypothetical protein